MEDFIFGTLATDELKLVHHRTARHGLQHDHDLAPRDPEPGQPVTIRVRVGPDLAADHVVCYYTTDGSEPSGEHGMALHGAVLPLEPAGVEWDTLTWGYLACWQAVLPPQPEGTVVRYRIAAWGRDDLELLADWPDVQSTAELACAAYFRGDPLPAAMAGSPFTGHTFTYHVDRLRPPAWARDAVIYEVFVDRFYPGDGRDWRPMANLSDFAGGTLWGVRDKLDYLADLGITCLWLTPIFASPSHHGYDATDLEHVEPRLGGDAALHALVKAAHARGLRVLLDYVCNHVSSEHPFFVAARQDPASPYRNWFLFDDSEIGYRTFFGAATMPQINVAHPAARAWLIDIARTWLREFQVDGYRLDYANGPGPDFWSDFWAACKAENPDCFCFGEVVDAPDAQRTYVGRLDGCLDFHLGDALRKTFAWGSWTRETFDQFAARHHAYFPPDFIMPTFLDNHDMDRFLACAGNDTAALRRAAEVQMRLPGPPIIYYGTEVGLSQNTLREGGWGLEVSRAPMLWGDQQDRDLLEFYRTLIRQRRARQVDR